MNFSIDIAIFLSFLALNLIVGLIYGQGVKNIQDYALGGRNFSTGALVATLVATLTTGSGFFIMLSKTYSDGIYYILASSGIAISLLITAIFFIPRMKEFLGKTSVAEAMGDIYGKHIRIIVAVAGIIGTIGMIAVQFKAFGNIFHYFLGFPEIFSIILAGSVVTIYSAFGGVRSVTFTDVLQFATFGVAIPLVGLLIWHQIYQMEGFSLLLALEDPKFDIRLVFDINNHKSWEMLPIFLYFAMPMLEPTFCQRIFLGRDVQQVKKAFIIAAAICLLLRLAIEWIPFLIYNVDPTIAPNQLLSYIIDHYTYPGLKGLIIVSITALAMSTADSIINSSSVLFSHDVCHPLNLVVKRELLVSRFFGFALGVGAMALAINGGDLLSIILTSTSFYTPIVVPPLALTILGFRSSTKSVLIGIGVGFITVCVWKLFEIQMDCIIFATIANLIALIASHYLLKQPGGWVKKVDDQISANKAHKLNYYQRLIKAVKAFSLTAFLRKQAPLSELTYTGFGVYSILCTFTAMYSTENELLGIHGRVIFTIYQIMLVTGFLITLYPVWPPRIKNQIFIQAWFNLAIFYMLAVFSIFFVLLSKFTTLQCMVFTMNTVIVITLAGWRVGGGMMFLGSYLGLQLYKYCFYQEVPLTADFAPQALILYALLLLSSVVVIFLKPTQDYRELLDEKIDYLTSNINDYKVELYKALELKYEFLRNLQHEARTPITGITSMAQVIDESYDKIPEEKRRKAIHDIALNAERLETYVNNLIDLSKLSSLKYDLKLEEVNLSALLEQKIKRISKLYIPDNEQDSRQFILNITPDIMKRCDEYYIGRTIENIIMNAIQFCQKGKIEITLSQDEGVIKFSVKDQGIGIPKENLKDIFGAFTTSMKTKTASGGRGVGLALAKTVVELHAGYIKAESDEKSWTKVSFVF